MEQIKTIDINAKEWFDKVNGNSYFSAEVITNYGTDDKIIFTLPFQYGYGDHYKHMATKELFEQGIISTNKFWELREQGIIVRANIQLNCKKKELVH